MGFRVTSTRGGGGDLLIFLENWLPLPAEKKYHSVSPHSVSLFTLQILLKLSSLAVCANISVTQCQSL